MPFPFICLVVVQSLSHVQLFATPRTATHQASPSFTISRRLLRLKSVESVNNHLTLCRPFFCPRPFLSIRVFSTESLFHSGGQSMGASASVLPMNIQGWFPLGLLYVCFMFLFSCQFYSAVWGTQSPRVSQARSNSHPYLCFWLSYLLFCCCWQKDIRLLVGESASNQP